MTEPADFSLNTGPSQEPPAPRHERAWIWPVGAVAAAAVVALAFYLFFRSTPEPQPAGTAAATAPAPTEQEVEPATLAPIELPALGASDDIVRSLLKGLSSRPELATWLATEQLVRNVTVVVDNINEGVSPARHLRALAPAQPFRVIGEESGGRVSIDPRSYARYNGLADTVAALDAAGVAKTYTNLRPLFDEAYRELGHPDGNFDAALQRAIAHLLATPDAAADAPVTSHVLSYHYTDPKLEELSGAQKHLLRMGPRNARLVKDQLREIARALGHDTSRTGR